jgi:ABC-type multidrug transport system fused ATPase/permease subunit
MAKRRSGEKRQRPTGKDIRRLLQLLRPHKGLFLLSLTMIFLSSVINMTFPWLMGKLFGTANPLSEGTGSLTIGNLSYTNSVVALLFITFAVQAVISFLRIIFSTRVTQNVLHDLRNKAFERLVEAPMEYHHRNKVGELTSRIATDINLLEETYNTTIAETLRQMIIVILGIGALFMMSWKLSLVMLSIIPVVAIVAVFFGRFISKLGKQAQDAAAQSNSVLEEALTAIVAVKSFTNELFELVRYRKQINHIKTLSIRNAMWRGAFVSFIIFCLFGSIVVVIWQGVLMVEAGTLNQDDFFAFILYTIFIGASIGSLPEMYAQLQKAAGSTRNLMEILDEKPEPGLEEDRPLSLKGDVAFEQVTFAYPTRPDITVINNLSFHAKAGERIAIVGPSGAGKSTITALLLRFYQPDSGRLLFDHTPAHEVSARALRKNMAIVPQEVILFGGSIRENIAYGKPDATEQEITDAARRANAMEFIEKFPDGMETVVGDRGVQLSGGQRQRIAIARAILRNPAILILDEATSSLDSESEHLVQQALDELMKGRTSFVVAHRLSTIRNCDRIMVIKQGQLVESGTHAQLMENPDGVYRALNDRQFAGAF